MTAPNSDTHLSSVTGACKHKVLHLGQCSGEGSDAGWGNWKIVVEVGAERTQAQESGKQTALLLWSLRRSGSPRDEKQPESLAAGRLTGNHISTGKSPGADLETDSGFLSQFSNSFAQLSRAQSIGNFPPCANDSRGAPQCEGKDASLVAGAILQRMATAAQSSADKVLPSCGPQAHPMRAAAFWLKL